jgi:hypothetical protein
MNLFRRSNGSFGTCSENINSAKANSGGNDKRLTSLAPSVINFPRVEITRLSNPDNNEGGRTASFAGSLSLDSAISTRKISSASSVSSHTAGQMTIRSDHASKRGGEGLRLTKTISIAEHKLTYA